MTLLTWANETSGWAECELGYVCEESDHQFYGYVEVDRPDLPDEVGPFKTMIQAKAAMEALQ